MHTLTPILTHYGHREVSLLDISILLLHNIHTYHISAFCRFTAIAYLLLHNLSTPFHY